MYNPSVIPYRIIAIGLILAAGVMLQLLGWFDWQRFLQVAEKYARTWWLPSAIVAIKITLYAFALPGSIMIWVAGLIYAPLAATIISVIGGVAGAVAAYVLSRRLSDGFSARVSTSRLFHFMRRHTDAATLSAVRTLPNFPHSVINYGAGIIGVPLPRFIISTTIGFIAKAYLYTTIIRNAAEADHLADAIDMKTLGPLFILATLFFIGKFIHQKSGAGEAK
jgi:uncharacterized membrane protein YdjX (TVP38/TMEM64 family)